MDGFFEKVCQHKDCGRHFDNLHKLILHIESTHIDFSCMDDDKIKAYLDSDDDDEFPTRGIPMSLVLPYSTEEQIAAFREEEELQAKRAEDNGENGVADNSSEIIDVLATDDAGDGHARPSSSKAYWCGPETSAPDAPPKTDTHRTHSPAMKKFACPVPGCTKSYKNVNGMKYHVVNYHDMHVFSVMKPVKQKKEFKCTYCGKDYKTFRGLQSHVQGHQQQPQQQQRRPQPQDPRGVPSPLMQQHRGRPFYQQRVDYYRQTAQQAHAPQRQSSSYVSADDVACFGECAKTSAGASTANLFAGVPAVSATSRQRLMMQMHQGATSNGDDGPLSLYTQGGYGARCAGAADVGNGYGFEDDRADADAHYQQLHKQYFQQQHMFGAVGQRVARGGGGGEYAVEPSTRTTESFEFVPVGHHRQDGNED